MSSHLESPRKIFDLGNGIAACACLTNPGIVALMTSRPARIAIEPGASTGGDPIELPRIAAQDIALLSKEFALVLDKEGTVWSVPFSEPTRVREIVRDMRAICARPAGDSAFAISEDNKVFVLLLGRGEVGARPVDVPGRTRALHVSDGGTSLVAEGDEGGQLRFYAGTTLDRAPNSRVTLPQQAADFDQVRGGRVLSVMFKRGGTSLCVVIREETRAEAKMIGLASALTDVAVTDASIVVAMVDGTLALYDVATLVAASEGFVAPTQSEAVRGTGRPRVVLATTIKGTTSIWVGTSAGEVMRASWVEDAAPAKASKEDKETKETKEDVVVAPPASSEVATLRQEAEEIRRALGASTTELQSRTNERDLLQTALDAKTLECQSRNEERERLESDLAEAAARATLLETRANDLDAKLNETLKARETLRDELERMKTELVQQRKEFESSRAKRIEGALPSRVVDGLEMLASLLGPRRH